MSAVEELREAWKKDTPVTVILSVPPCTKPSHHGKVRHVAPTDTFAIVGATHIPVDAVKAVLPCG